MFTFSVIIFCFLSFLLGRNFKKIMPNDYNKMLVAIGKFEEKGLNHEQAVLEAFYSVQK